MSIFDDLPDLPEVEGEPTDWDEDSFAVIACDGGGQGCVLWTTGPHVRFEMEEGGLTQLFDLGLDDAPLGISVWQGKYIGACVGSGDYGRDYGREYVDLKPSGSFREPTEEEWFAIRQGKSPWEQKQ